VARYEPRPEPTSFGLKWSRDSVRLETNSRAIASADGLIASVLDLGREMVEIVAISIRHRGDVARVTNEQALARIANDGAPPAVHPQPFVPALSWDNPASTRNYGAPPPILDAKSWDTASYVDTGNWTDTGSWGTKSSEDYTF